jgi:hypothetical protein
MNLYDCLGLWYNKRFEEFKHFILSENFLNKNYFNFDSNVYELWMRSISDYDSGELASNQSHSSNNKYFFSPLSQIGLIEGIFKKTNGELICHIFGNTNSTSDQTIKATNINFCDFSFVYNCKNPSFENLLKYHGSLRSNPQTWMYLSKEKSFLDFLKISKIDSLITTGWDADFPKKEFQKYVHINDNMINWKTGECFFTCINNNKHTFPFFIKKGRQVANLLNMYEKKFYESDDYFELDYSPCECGLKWPTISRFESHINMKYKPKKTSLQNLVGQYLNFQIVCNKNKEVTYFMKTRDNIIPKEDLNYLFDIYGKGDIYKNHRFVVGIDKTPFFCGFDGNYKIIPFLKKPIKFL